MAQQKPIIMFDNRLNDCTPTATSTAVGYDVLNLRDLRPYTWWKATSTATQYITTPLAGAKTANCLAIYGHNLGTIGATVSVECSSDNFQTDVTVALAGFVPMNDKAILKTFTQLSKQDWRLKITGASAAAQMAILCIGDKLQFERFVTGNFDPNEEEIKGRSLKDDDGQLLGADIDHIKVAVSVSWKYLTPSWVKNSFRPAWDSHIRRLKPFFFAWDPGDHPDEVYFVRVPDGHRLRMPYDPVRRSLTLDLHGVGEL